MYTNLFFLLKYLTMIENAILYGQIEGMGMKKELLLLLFFMLLMPNVTSSENLLIAGIGTSDFGVAIIGIAGALLMRSIKEKK